MNVRVQLAHIDADGIEQRRLRERLAELVSSPERCRTLGGIGRERVRSSFTWSKIITRFGALWRHQISRRASARAQQSSLQLRNAFAHYPSKLISDVALVRSDSSLANFAEVTWGDYDQRSRLVRTCMNHPRLIGEIIATDGVSLDCILGLLKKGFLELCY